MSLRLRWVACAALLLAACHQGGLDDDGLRIVGLHLSLTPCGTTADGGMRCWGYVDPRLGAPAGTDGAFPVPASGAPRLATVHVSWDHGCGLDGEGAAWCWGDNRLGQLGVGWASASEPPSRVATSLRFRSVQSGAEGSCGLATDGEVYCWGGGEVVLAGTPAADRCLTYTWVACALEPTRIAAPGPFSGLAVADWTACATGAPDGVHCWGIAPELLPPNLGALETISLSNTGLCGMRAGAVVCWLVGGYPPRDAAVIPFPEGTRIRSVSIGEGHACALDAVGKAWCWGYGLGVGNASIHGSPTPVPVIGDLVFSQLGASHGYSCGVAGDGAWCWGQVGDYRAASIAIPTRVAGQGGQD